MKKRKGENGMDRTFWELAWEGVRRKKRSSILIFLVLLISFSFLIVSLAVTVSISRTNDELCQAIYGQWDYAVPAGKEEDAAWIAEKQEEGLVKQVGRMENYGTLGSGENAVGFGTLDEGMIEVGRLSLEEGRWPEAPGEIVLEAKTLEALGYEAKTGQTVRLELALDQGGTPVTVEQAFTVCGVVRDFSSLWLLNYNKTGRLLVSAVVTPETARQLAAGADPLPQYFLEAPEDNLLRFQLGGQMDAYLAESRAGTQADTKACTNPGGAQSVGQVQYNGFFFGLIVGVTMLAVACVYLLRLPAELHSCAVLRSIGTTRKQLAQILGAETLLLAVPAVVLGIPCGALGTRLALGLLVFSDSVPVAVSLPWLQLVLAALLWAGAIFAARFILFAIVVQMPLTGRFSLNRKTARRLRMLRGGMVAGLLALFGVTVIFCKLQVMRQENFMEASSDTPYYTISKAIPEETLSPEEWEKITYTSKDQTEIRYGTVSREDRQFFEQIPGTQLVYGFTTLDATLSFPGMEERNVRLIGLDAELWDKVLDFGSDREAFEKGELVLVCFPGEDLPDYLLSDAGKEPEKRVYLRPEEDLSNRDYLEPEGDVTLHFYANDGSPLGTHGVASSVRTISYETIRSYMGLIRTGYYNPYAVICSPAFIEKILADLPAGQALGPLVTGGDFGYSEVSVRLETYANSTVADTLVAAYCRQNGLSLNNQRQTQAAQDIQAQQQVVLLYAAGGAVAVMSLLVLTGLLSLESEQEKQSFRLLRALGLSAWQQRARVLGKVLARGFASVVSGWGLFLATLTAQIMISAATPMPEMEKEAQFISPWEALQSGLVSLTQIKGVDWDLVGQLSLVCLVVPLAVLLLAKLRLLKGEMKP